MNAETKVAACLVAFGCYGRTAIELDSLRFGSLGRWSKRATSHAASEAAAAAAAAAVVERTLYFRDALASALRIS